MTKPQPSTFPSRLSVALTAAIAAIATAAVLAATGSAQTQPTTLHLLTKAQRNVGFFPKHRQRPGDQFSFGDRVTGEDTGSTRIVCTVVSSHDTAQPCIVWLKLSKGTLTGQGFFPDRARQTAVAITGGTGAYNAARGTAVSTNITQTSSRITINLLP